MSGCGFSQKAILFFYGELTGEEADSARDHLGECPLCRERLAVLETASAVMNAGRKEPSTATVQNIMAEARKRAGQWNFADWARFVFGDWKMAALTVSFAALIFGLFLNYNGCELTYKWDSGIASSIENLQYAVQEEKSLMLGDYMETWDLEQAELINEQRRLL